MITCFFSEFTSYNSQITNNQHFPVNPVKAGPNSYGKRLHTFTGFTATTCAINRYKRCEGEFKNKKTHYYPCFIAPVP